VSREDLFNIDPNLEVDSDSDVLLSGGVTYEKAVEGLGQIPGLPSNSEAIDSLLLKVPGHSGNLLEPETASSIHVGLQ